MISIPWPQGAIPCGLSHPCCRACEGIHIDQLQPGSVKALVQALNMIAAWTDTRAEMRLEATGSYSAFDEPASVQIARTALASFKGESNSKK